MGKPSFDLSTMEDGELRDLVIEAQVLLGERNTPRVFSEPGQIVETRDGSLYSWFPGMAYCLTAKGELRTRSEYKERNMRGRQVDAEPYWVAGKDLIPEYSYNRDPEYNHALQIARLFFHFFTRMTQP